MVRATGSVQGGHPPARPERLSMPVATLLRAPVVGGLAPGQQPHRPVRRGL